MSVINITDQAHFNREIESHSGFVVIDFWAEFCGPCRRIAPDYEQLAAKSGIDILPNCCISLELRVPMNIRTSVNFFDHKL